MHSSRLIKFGPPLPLLLFGNCLLAQNLNLLTNGSLERPGGGNYAYEELPPGSTALPGWPVGPQGSVDTIRTYAPASDGRDSLDLHSFNFGPGSVFQDVNLTNGVRYRLSFDLAYNPCCGQGVQVSVTVGGVSNQFTRVPSTPYWQRRSFIFTATNTGLTRLTFTENGAAPTGSPETAIDNVVLEAVRPHAVIRVSQVEVCWDSETNVVYQLQARSEASTNWIAVGSTVEGNGGTNCITDTVSPSDSRRIYRIVSPP